MRKLLLLFVLLQVVISGWSQLKDYLIQASEVNGQFLVYPALK